MILPHPDLSRIRILRKSGDVTVDLANAIDACTDATPPETARAAAVPLQPGDRIELPLLDSDAPWHGFDEAQSRFFAKVLSGSILVSSGNETETRPIDWSPVRWELTESGIRFPVTDREGWPTTRASYRFPNLIAVTRNGANIGGDLSRVFLRDGDMVRTSPALLVPVPPPSVPSPFPGDSSRRSRPRVTMPPR